ncbi:MAG TPA: helix-turn-helix transcriptional regulator [Bacillota bacterium]|jgi:putative transcriptional regulator|nr:helix-turn-helix transcriptional regulator [Bacillota bacterium]HOL15990.1 helix-turn-helix transcriptional regulator [Bacillota bacterium]
MAVSYNKLWKLLVDKKMSKADLRKAAGVSPNTMTKLRRDMLVALDVLDRICGVLNVSFGDIMDYVPEKERAERCGR